MIDHITKHYRSLAKVYDSRWEGYLRSTHEVALELLGSWREGKLLDASGGTGLLAEKILQKRKRVKVEMVDISKEMLTIAKKRLEGEKRVKISKQDVHKLSFRSGTFDRVACLSSFHYYDHPQKALAEFRRVLKKNGKFIFIDWCCDPLYFNFLNFMTRRNKKAHYRTYSSPEMHRMLQDAGFVIEKKKRWKYSWWSLMAFVVKKA